MRVCLDWKSKCAGQTKVSKFDGLSSGVNKQVLWLQVAMEDAMLVQVDKSLQDLVEEALCLLLWERGAAVLSHVLLQVELNVLEDQVQLLLGVDDLNQTTRKQEGHRY